MDSLRDILPGREPNQPPEIEFIKKYIYDNFQEKVKVVVREREIVINVASAGLANTLRLQGKNLQTAASTNKRLVFRIG